MAISFNTANLLLSGYTASSSAISGYFNTKAQQSSARSEASHLIFLQGLGNINANLLESQIQYMARAGEKQQGLASLRYGQEKAKEKEGLASKNIDITSGTASERIASIDVAKEVDLLTMNANTVMQLEAQKTAKVNAQNEADLQGVRGAGLRSVANSLSPFASAFTGVASGLADYGSRWLMAKAGTGKTLLGS